MFASLKLVAHFTVHICCAILLFSLVAGAALLLEYAVDGAVHIFPNTPPSIRTAIELLAHILFILDGICLVNFGVVETIRFVSADWKTLRKGN
jgi:hypothetical protein